MKPNFVSFSLAAVLFGGLVLSGCASEKPVADAASGDSAASVKNTELANSSQVTKDVLVTLLQESAGAEYDQAVAAIEASALDFATSPGSQAKLAAVYAGADLADFTLDNAEGDSFVFFSVCSDVDGTITVNDQNVPCGIENGGRHEWAAAYGGESKVAHKVTTYKADDGKLFVVKVTGK